MFNAGEVNSVNDNYMVSTPRTHLTALLPPYMVGITMVDLTWEELQW